LRLTCDSWNSDVAISGVTVFTDGSVVNGSVGYGACAAVLFPTVDGDEKIVQSRAVSKKVSIYHCEVEGIVLGLSMIVDYFCKYDNGLNLEIVHLFSDSCAAINAVEKCTSTIRPDTYSLLLNLRQLLYNMNIRVLLGKIQSHSDILGNEIADKEAELVAREMSGGKIAVSDEGSLSIGEAYRMSSDIVHKCWQLYCDNESTGHTYNLIIIIVINIPECITFSVGLY